MHQPDSRKLPFGCAALDGLHQLTARRPILRCRINRDWPNASDGIPFVHADASDNFSVPFTHHAEKRGVRKQHREDANWNFWNREFLREIVVFGEAGEGFKTDSSTHFRISRSCP